METGELRRYRSSWDLDQCGRLEGGVFRSRWYAGLGPGMEWLRLTLDGPEGLRVRVYARDTPLEEPEAGVPALERTANDLLLYGVRGRYLTFSVEPGAELRGFTLSFPGRSIAEGLPAVLQDDPTLRALLAVYQSGYLDLNSRLRAFPGRLDPGRPDALPQLARWLGAERWAADPAAGRKLLPQAALLARLRGTRRGLQLLSRLLTGHPCRLAGDGGAKLHILASAQADRTDVNQLRRVLRDFIPAGVPYTLIHLEDGAPMDGHCYLDENAVLTEPPAWELDGPETDELCLED